MNTSYYHIHLAPWFGGGNHHVGASGSCSQLAPEPGPAEVAGLPGKATRGHVVEAGACVRQGTPSRTTWLSWS